MEIEPNVVIEKEKHWNKLDEAYGFLCLSIFKDLLFHLYGLKTPMEAWEKFLNFLESSMIWEPVSWIMNWSLSTRETLRPSMNSSLSLSTFCSNWRNVKLRRKMINSSFPSFRNLSQITLFLCLPFILESLHFRIEAVDPQCIHWVSH